MVCKKAAILSSGGNELRWMNYIATAPWITLLAGSQSCDQSCDLLSGSESNSNKIGKWGHADNLQIDNTRADSRFVLSQWETSLLCTDVSH